MVARVGKILLFGLSCCMFATASLSQTPQVLQFGTTTSGTMNRDSDHWFQITTTLDGSLTITIRSDSTLTTMLYLYDHDMTTQMVFQSASSSPLKTIAGKNLSPGIYYLKIHYYGGEGKYAISPDFSEASYRNDNEPNNTTEQALRLKTSGSLTGHLGFYGGGFTDKDDWWQIDTILDGSIYVTAEVDSTLGMTLTLFDENLVERPVMDPSLEPAQQTIHRDNLAMGTYYVRAHCDSGYGSYTISSQVIPAAYLNDSEPNDDTINAQEIVPEKTFTGHLGYSDCGISDIIDYYRFTITSRYNDLIIRSETLGKLEFNLYLFDNKGNRLKYTTEKGASKVLHYYEADPGTYYIQMLQDTGYGSYAFVVTASTATQPEVIVNNPPVILSTTLPDASIDQPYEYRIIAQDPDKDNVVSYEILEGPAWLGINNSGVLGGTPDSDDAGSYIPVLIRVYDQNNLGCLFNTMIIVKDITIHGSYPALDLSLGIPGYQGGTMISNPGPGKLFGFAVYIRDNVTTRGFTLTFRWDKTKAEFRKSQSGAEISDDTITINGITDLTLASEKNMLVSDGTGSLTSVGERYEDGFYTVSWAKMGGDAITAPEGLLYLAVFRTASDLSENDYFPVLVEVSVSDETGNVQSLKPAEFFIGSPVYPPTVITVKDIPDDNGHSAALSWNLSPDDPNVMHYSIYRSRHPEISDPIPLASFKTVAELAEAEKTHMILIASVPNGVNSFLDTAIPVSGVHYYYWLQAVTQSGASEKIAALPLGSVTSVEELPAAFRVFPPYPNPFNPVTLIRYEIPTGCKISLAVYDILGRKAALLVDGYIPAGLHEALWNGRDDSGRSMSSGVYFYRFEAGKEYVSQGKMLLLR